MNSCKQRTARQSRFHRLAFFILLLISIAAYNPPATCAQDGSQSPLQGSSDSGARSKSPPAIRAKNAADQQSGDSAENKLGLQTIKNIIRDQREIWTSPTQVRLGHADWLVPYAGITAGFLVTDRDSSLHLSNSANSLKNYRDFSNYGLVAMAGSVGGLYLHSPSGPAVTPAVAQVIASADGNSVFPSNPIPARNQARLLDAYVGLNLANWQISYGQESEWWSPNQSGPLPFSDNAFPVRTFRINRVSPFRLPGLFKFLGPVHRDMFFDSLQGHQISPGPFFHGEKMSFKPTRNLEFGFSRTVVLGGEGRPLTLDRLFRSYFSVTSVNGETPANDPGKCTGGFDFSYRVPLLRDWLTIYTDSLADDDPSPLAAPRRAGINPGMYVSHFPGLPKLDLRVEAPLTNTVAPKSPGQYIYWDGFYHDLYTNRGYLMGNWVGRDGAGIQAFSRYWLSARNAIQFGYRHSKVDPKFIPGGGTLNVGSVSFDFWIQRYWSASAFVQYEQWKFPVLASSLQKNVTASIQLSYWPQMHAH
jgi:capsule assembly protein Wzi